jgi:pyruvate/2-oxoglutarate dehydrogenase complex dihydrolipoamide dehydrogenase (E3) component
MPDVYSGGDCISGPATVIQAIAAGKVAAANIDNYLGFHHEIVAEVKVPEPRIADRVPCGRVNMKERPVEERSDDFELSELGMSDQEAMQESRRCLRCDHFGFGVFKGGRIERW